MEKNIAFLCSSTTVFEIQQQVLINISLLTIVIFKGHRDYFQLPCKALG